MEDVLDVYKRPYDPARPVVGLDEKPAQLRGDVREPQSAAPGRPARRDSEYRRGGTANIFCAFEPLAGRRRLVVTDRRTKRDFAVFVKSPLDGRYRDVEKLALVLDNLNTHSPAGLYESFGPAEARRLADRLEIHHTPKHGSWLNVAAIELSALGRRLPDRVPNTAALVGHVAAVEQDRNEHQRRCDRHFTTAEARVKLKRLYPSIEER